MRTGGFLGLPGYQPGSRFSEKLCLKGVKEWRGEKGKERKVIQGDEGVGKEEGRERET